MHDLLARRGLSQGMTRKTYAMGLLKLKLPTQVVLTVQAVGAIRLGDSTPPCHRDHRSRPEGPAPILWDAMPSGFGG